MLNEYDMKKLVPILIFSFFTINCLKAKKSPFDISSPSGLFGVGINLLVEMELTKAMVVGLIPTNRIQKFLALLFLVALADLHKAP
jgi:hypothetical protein